MMRPVPFRIAVSSAALVLAVTAGSSRAEGEPTGELLVAPELAHVLQQQRQQIADARALVADAGVGERSDADPATASLDALEAALTAEGLLEPGATRVAERSAAVMGSSKMAPPVSKVGLPQGSKVGMPPGSKTAPPSVSKMAPPPPPPGAVKNPAATVKNPSIGPIAHVALPAAPRSELASVARLIGNDAPPELVKARWQQALQNARPGTDPNALVQQVLRDSLLETQRDLAFYAEKVKYHNELKRSLREEMGRLREQESGASPAEKARIQQAIAVYERRLQAVEHDAQLANVDLQNILQKQQQTMQTMANIAKMLHETAMAVIRKMGG